MAERRADGSAGDADDRATGRDHVAHRQPEPAIADLVHATVADARTMLNIGAGAGSYEPPDRVDPAIASRAVARLRRDQQLGEWDPRHGDLRAQAEFDGSLRPIVGQP